MNSLRYEVIRLHPASCRVNLLCWDLTWKEAARVLAELRDAQSARQGAVVIGGHVEMGWTYDARAQGVVAP